MAHRCLIYAPPSINLSLTPTVVLFSPDDMDVLIQVTRGRGNDSKQFILSILFTIRADTWKHLWSIAEYKKELVEIANSHPDIDLIDARGDEVVYSELRKVAEVFRLGEFVPRLCFKFPTVKDTSLTIETVISNYSITVNQLHDLTEKSLISKLGIPQVKRIIRSIEFPPEYHRSGITILSYFADVLRHKNLSEEIKVSIEQSGLNVRLIIESPTGQQELVERTLETYALVVTGKSPIDALTTDPYEVAELKSQLRIASAQIESQRDLLAVKNSEAAYLRTDVEGTKASLKRLEHRADEDRARLMALIEGLVSHNTDLSSSFRALTDEMVKSQNKALADALENLYKMIERGVREEDKEQVIQNLTTIQREDPSVLRQVSDILIKGAISGAAGNYLYAWLQFFIGSLPK